MSRCAGDGPGVFTTGDHHEEIITRIEEGLRLTTDATAMVTGALLGFEVLAVSDGGGELELMIELSFIVSKHGVPVALAQQC